MNASESVPPAAPNIYDRLVGAIGKAGGYACVIASVALLTYEVIARNLFNSPTKFTLEFGLMCQVLLTALASAYVLRERGHIGSELLTERVSLRSRLWLEIFGHLIGIALCAFIAWAVLRSALWALKVNILTDTLELPLAPLLFVFVGGISLLMGQFANEILKNVRRLHLHQAGKQSS